MSDEASSPAASSSSEIKTGRSADLAAGGFKEMPSAPERKEREFKTAREAGRDLANKRTVDTWPEKPIETVPIEYKTPRGDRAPANEAIDLKRGADDLIALRKSQHDQAELGAAVEFEKDLSLHKWSEGIVPDDATTAQIEQEFQQQQPQREQQPATPGLAPEVQAALKHPQVREAIQAEVEKTQATQAEYSKAVGHAYKASLAIIGSSFPELQNLNNDQIVQTLQQMQHTNPKRFERVYNALQGAAQVETALIADQKRQIEHHERVSREQDQIFERSIAHVTPQQRAEISREIQVYAREMGLTTDNLANALKQNPVLRTAVFQKVIFDAVTARIAKRDAQNYRSKLDRSAPPVQKPGVPQPRSTPAQSNLDALNKRLNGAKTQQDQLTAAAAILAAKRRGGR